VSFLVEALNAEGVNVQLKHDDEETSWEAHGWISLVRDADGTELHRSDDFQHNRKYRQMRENAGKIVEAVTAALDDEPEVVTSKAADDAAAAPPAAPLARSDSAEAA